MVRRIRKMLRLEAKTGSMGIGLAAFAFCRAIQKIPAVKLDSRLRREHFQNPSARRLKNFGGNL